MKSLSINEIKTNLHELYLRYYLITFFIVVAATFGAAVLHVSLMTQSVASDPSITSSTRTQNLDTQTLQRLNGLSGSSSVSSLSPANASNRTSPFSE